MKILIIEKDLIARLVIKNIIYKSLKVDKEQLEVFTTPNPLQGIGTCFVINPDVIIYDEKEYITEDKSIDEYISSNKNILNKSPIIIKNFSRFIEDSNFVQHYSEFLEDKLKQFNLSNQLHIDIIERIILKLLYPLRKNSNSKLVNKFYPIFNNLYLDLLTGIYRIFWDRKNIEKDELTVTYEKKAFNQRIYPKLFIASSIIFSILLNITLSLLPILGLGYFSTENAVAQVSDSCIAIDKDFNQQIGFLDLASIASKYNDECLNTSYYWGCGSIDSNSDGNIDVVDLAYLVQKYNQSCFKGNEWFISPTGSIGGDGSIENPWDLATGLNSFNTIQPGDTLWLRGGTYGTGGGTLYQSKLIGTQQNPIVIKSYPNEWAIVDGGIEQVSSSGASNMWFWGFEITNSNSNRSIDGTTDFRSSGFNLYSPGTKVINMVLNNTGHPAIGFWSPIGDKGEVYGNVAWGNGVLDNTPEYNGAYRGAAVYGQNQTGNRNIENNIFFSNFSTGLSTHGVDGYVNNFTYKNNSVFNHGQADFIAYSTNHGTSNLILDSNNFYSIPGYDYGGIKVGTYGNNQDIQILNNLVYRDGYGIYFKDYQSVTLANNKIISNSRLVEQYNSVNTFNSTSNSFILRGRDALSLDSVSSFDFNSLKTHLSDSTSILEKALPSTNAVYLRTNKYEYGKANLTIYNFEQNTSYSLNPSSFLAYGDYYLVRDVLNYHAPIIKSRYLGSNISLPLNLYEYESLIGAPINISHTHTAPFFNNFVIERVNNIETQKVNPPILNGELTFVEASHTIELTSSTTGANIYYTIDGSEATPLDTLYTSPFTINSTTTINSMATKDGFEDSVKLRYEVTKVDLNSDLLAYYQFEDLSGTTVTNSSNDINKYPGGLIVSGTINNEAGINGNAYKFSNGGGYISVGSHYLPNQYTLTGWAKSDKLAGDTIINNGTASWSTLNYRLRLQNNDVVSIASNLINNSPQASGITSSNCNNILEWNFYVATYDGLNLKLYCNGLLKGELTSIASGATSTGGTLQIGYNGYNEVFSGLIDEVRIYNRALNQKEIESLYSQYSDLI